MTKDIDQKIGLADGKVCRKCQKFKLLEDYYKRTNGTPHSECKECIKKRNMNYDANNKGKVIERRRANRRKNKEYYNKKSKEWRLANPEKHKASVKAWVDANPEKMKQINSGKNKKRSNDPRFRVSSSLSRAIRHSLKSGEKGGRHWESLVGYTIEELVAHLENQFLPGMSWENYGKNGWHIDHIIPIAAHNFNTIDDEDFRKCWALNNLQPLWAMDNYNKGAKLNTPFQPSLALSVNDNSIAINGMRCEAC